MTVQCLLALLFQAVPLLGGPPNLLLMAVDNLGWDDVSWHNPSIIMPNLGTLARCLLLPSYSETNKGGFFKGGVQFTRAHQATRAHQGTQVQIPRG